MVNKKQEKIVAEIEDIERQLEKLPIGSISRKMINGKSQYYHQWYEAGKVKSKYIHSDDLADMQKNMQLKKKLKTKLATLKNKLESGGSGVGLKAAITFPLEINAYYDKGILIPDRRIQVKEGDRIIVTIRESECRSKAIDLDKYVNTGKKLFEGDAQEIIKRGRSEER